MKTLSVILLALLCVLGVSFVESAPAQRRDSTRMKTILVLGDSLSDGFRLPRKEAYPALLAEKLREEGLPFEVINASASGGTSSGALTRLPPHLRRQIDILVVQLGINDAFRGVPISEVRGNLQAIIGKTKARSPDCEIVIVGMQLPIFAEDNYVRTFGEMYKELADKNNAALVPYLLEGVGGNPVLNLPDRIHPNALGQRVLAENVWRVLEAVARRVATKQGAASAAFVP